MWILKVAYSNHPHKSDGNGTDQAMRQFEIREFVKRRLTNMREFASIKSDLVFIKNTLLDPQLSIDDDDLD